MVGSSLLIGVKECIKHVSKDWLFSIELNTNEEQDNHNNNNKCNRFDGCYNPPIINANWEIFLTSFAIINILYTPPKEYKYLFKHNIIIYYYQQSILKTNAIINL